MLNAWIDQWRAQSLPIGFLIAYLLQAAMYVGSAGEIGAVYGTLRRKLGIGSLIDAKPLPANQLRDEIVRSLGACFIFAIPTLVFLHYSTTIWPVSWLQAAWQVG